MRKVAIVSISMALVFAAMGAGAAADQPTARTFITVLSSDEETGTCVGVSNSARGLAVFHVTDEATGTVEYRIVANNLPGTTSAAHIHIGPPGVAGPVVQLLAGAAGNEQGVIATGSFSNPTLLAAIRANPSAYYVNVHTTPTCPAGVIRGQLGDHGPVTNSEAGGIQSPASRRLPDLRCGRRRDGNVWQTNGKRAPKVEDRASM